LSDFGDPFSLGEEDASAEARRKKGEGSRGQSGNHDHQDVLLRLELALSSEPEIEGAMAREALDQDLEGVGALLRSLEERDDAGAEEVES